MQIFPGPGVKINIESWDQIEAEQWQKDKKFLTDLAINLTFAFAGVGTIKTGAWIFSKAVQLLPKMTLGISQAVGSFIFLQGMGNDIKGSY